MADNTDSPTPTLTEQVGKKAKQQTEQVKQQTQQVKDQVKDQAQQAVQQGQQTVSHVWELGRNQFRSQVTGQKERAATGLDDIAQLIRQSGSQLGEQGHAGSSHYADMIADRIAQVAGTVHGKEVEELLADTENFARARPAVFLSIAAVLGFLLARFLKSSGDAAFAS